MSSFSVRALDFVQSIQILMDNFLFGIGINGEYLQNYVVITLSFLNSLMLVPILIKVIQIQF